MAHLQARRNQNHLAVSGNRVSLRSGQWSKRTHSQKLSMLVNQLQQSYISELKKNLR